MPEEPRHFDDEDSYLDGFLETAFLTADPDSPLPLSAHRDPTELPPRHPQYEVLEHIGRGAVGDVYRIQDRELGRKLALKVLRPAHMGDAPLTECFREEARLCSQLTHPGIVPLHESGTLDDGRPYFTMKLVEGRSFAEMLRSPERPKQRAELLQILLKVCQAIAFAHAQGVVHGDLKPQNFMIGRYGEVQVMDWGFALRTRSDERRLGTRARAGTPAYMAPEQAQASGAITTRTDVYGLGAILFETLLGHSPHQTASGMQVQSSEALQEQLAAGSIEQPLIELTMRCLASDPEQRPADAEAMEEALSAFLESLAQRAHEMELRAAAAQASLEHSRRARRFALLAFASILTGVLVVGALLMWSSLEQQRELTELTEQVADARSEAESRRALAQRDRDPQHWDQAVAAAERALALAGSPGGSEELKLATGRLVEAMRAGRDRAESLVALIDKLERIVPHVGDDRSAQELEGQFAKAFASIGVSDAQTPDASSLAAARSELDDPEILQALDSWIVLRKKHGLPDSDAWRLPFAYAQAIDVDPGHRQIREAYVQDELSLLREMSEEEALAQLAPEALEFLGRCLFEANARARSLAVYERAHRLYPGNHRISHNLAILLDVHDQVAQQRSFRLLSMALATRPEDEHLHTDIAVNRLTARDFEAAKDWATRAISLEHDSGRAHYVLGIAQENLGAQLESLRSLERSHELGYRPAAIVLAQRALQESRYLRALPLLELAHERDSRDRRLELQLALAHAELRHYERAKARFDALEKKHPRWIEMHARRGLFRLTTGDFDGALASAEIAAELHGDRPAEPRLDEWIRSIRAAVELAERLLPELVEGRYSRDREGLHQALWLCYVKGLPELGAKIFGEMRAFGELPTSTMFNGIEMMAQLALQADTQARRQELRARVHEELDMELAAIVRVVREQPERAVQQRLLLERFHESPVLRALDELPGQPADQPGTRAKLAEALTAIDA